MAISVRVAQWKLFTSVDVLVAVDTEVSTDPANHFGIASVIALIRATVIGWTRFGVDFALRNSGSTRRQPRATPTQPKYTGFRFNMTDGGFSVNEKYQQICASASSQQFGAAPTMA